MLGPGSHLVRQLVVLGDEETRAVVGKDIHLTITGHKGQEVLSKYGEENKPGLVQRV